jgi:GTP-binding protein EngB required for normal cell division
MYTGIIRYILFGLVAAALLGLMLFSLLFIDTLLSIADRLAAMPLWLSAALGLGLFLLSLPVAWLVYRLFRLIPSKPGAHPEESKSEPPPDRKKIEERISHAESLGADASCAHEELKRLTQRKDTGTVYAALYGNISSGKSTLIRALLPDAEAESSIIGGTTRELKEYTWQSPAGDRLVLIDMPGLEEAAGELDDLASDEALRAHLVIYLCEGDLTRTQMADIESLATLGKPLVVAINKIDRFSSKDLESVRARVIERISGLIEKNPRILVAPVSAGGKKEVVIVGPDEVERRELRDTPPQVDSLKSAVQELIDESPETLESLRDTSVFVLAERRLERAIAERRRQQAQTIVENGSKKAIAGALAAITPGTDLLIQGYIATRLVKDLCDLYEVPVRKIDIDELLKMIQSRTTRVAALVLAIAGNALKAFPGAGTLAGGVVHAIAYGIIIDALGKSVMSSLESRGALRPRVAAEEFKEYMGENLDLSAKHFARLAFQEAKRLGGQSK